MLLCGPIKNLELQGCALLCLQQGCAVLCLQRGHAGGPGAAARSLIDTRMGSLGSMQETRGVELLFSSLTNYSSQERQGCLGCSITIVCCCSVGCECFVILHSVA